MHRLGWWFDVNLNISQFYTKKKNLNLKFQQGLGPSLSGLDMVLVRKQANSSHENSVFIVIHVIPSNWEGALAKSPILFLMR